MDIKKIVGNNIKDYRISLGYTQKQIAKYLDVDRSIISRYENGERDGATLVHLCRLADLFGIDVVDFSEENIISKPVNFAFAFRRDGFDEQDMDSIAAFQKIVKNYMQMNEILNKNE